MLLLLELPSLTNSLYILAPPLRFRCPLILRTSDAPLASPRRKRGELYDPESTSSDDHSPTLMSIDTPWEATPAGFPRSPIRGISDQHSRPNPTHLSMSIPQRSKPPPSILPNEIMPLDSESALPSKEELLDQIMKKDDEITVLEQDIKSLERQREQVKNPIKPRFVAVKREESLDLISSDHELTPLASAIYMHNQEIGSSVLLSTRLDASQALRMCHL